MLLCYVKSARVFVKRQLKSWQRQLENCRSAPKVEDCSTPEIGTGTLYIYVCIRRRATSADRRQRGVEREPRNVQVVILEVEHGMEDLSFWNNEGALLEVDPEIEHVGARRSDDREKTEPANTIEGLQAALNCTLEENE